MRETPTSEYIHLFKAISKTIESLQERLIFYTVSKRTADYENIDYLQKLQLFLIEAQQKAEDIFLDRTEQASPPMLDAPCVLASIKQQK